MTVTKTMKQHFYGWWPGLELPGRQRPFVTGRFLKEIVEELDAAGLLDMPIEVETVQWKFAGFRLREEKVVH